MAKKEEKRKETEGNYRICFRCQRPIDKRGNFYQFIEWNEEKIVKIDYAHRSCWDEFLKRVGDTTEAMTTMRQLKGKLQQIGFLEPEVVNLT